MVCFVLLKEFQKSESKERTNERTKKGQTYIEITQETTRNEKTNAGISPVIRIFNFLNGSTTKQKKKRNKRNSQKNEIKPNTKITTTTTKQIIIRLF